MGTRSTLMSHGNGTFASTQMCSLPQIVDRRMKHKLGRQRQRVIKRLRRAKELREAEDRKIAMRLEQANQVPAVWFEYKYFQHQARNPLLSPSSFWANCMKRYRGGT